MSKITTCLWFAEKNGVEAVAYYVETFTSAPGEHEGKSYNTFKSPKAAEEVSGIVAGEVMTIECELDGAKFMALNGGPVEGFKFSPATSFIVSCETQEEIDHFWEKLSANPATEQCGWCTDKFGVTWQIVPRILDELMADPTKVEKVTAAFMPMKKLDLEAIRKAGE